MIPLYNYWSHQNKIPTKIVYVMADLEITGYCYNSDEDVFWDPKSKLQEFLKKYYYPSTPYKNDNFYAYIYALKDPIGAMQEAHDLATIPFKRALNHNR